MIFLLTQCFLVGVQLENLLVLIVWSIHKHSQAFTLTSGRKTSWFDNHRKFLTHEHPFRRNKNAFIKNRTEMSPSPPIKTGAQILQEIDNLGVRRVILMLLRLIG